MVLVTQKNKIQDYFDNIDHKDYVEMHNRALYGVIYEEMLESPAIRNMLTNRGLVIVDLGAASCDFELFLLDRSLGNSHAIIAIDFSRSMLKKGIVRLGSNCSNCVLLAADIIKCPVASGCSDVVFCINTVSYVTHLHMLFREVNRILKPKGYFVIVRPSNERIWEREFGGIRVFSARDLKGIASDYDFETVEEKVITLSPNKNVKSMVVPITNQIIFRVKR